MTPRPPCSKTRPSAGSTSQGNFITGFFPEGSQAGVDYDFFYFPPVDEAYGKPFLVAGDLMTMFTDRPEVRALMEFFTTPQSASGWLTTAAHWLPTKPPPRRCTAWNWSAASLTLVTEATSFRFDGSDLMPGEVGSGSFWTGMVDYICGAADLDTVLAEIDASWPEGVAGQPPPTTEEEAMGMTSESGIVYLPGGGWRKLWPASTPARQ